MTDQNVFADPNWHRRATPPELTRWWKAFDAADQRRRRRTASASIVRRLERMAVRDGIAKENEQFAGAGDRAPRWSPSKDGYIKRLGSPEANLYDSLKDFAGKYDTTRHNGAWNAIRMLTPMWARKPKYETSPRSCSINFCARSARRRGRDVHQIPQLGKERGRGLGFESVVEAGFALPDIRERDKEAEKSDAERERNGTDALIGELFQLNPDNPDDKTERDELFRIFAEAVPRLQAFMAKERARQERQRAVELATMQKACRQARDERDRLKTEHARLMDEWNLQVLSTVLDAREKLIEAEGSVPHADSWPTKAQIQRAEARVTKAREALAEAAAYKNKCMEQINQVALALRDAEDKLQDLAGKEKALRSPDGYWDRETGLWSQDVATRNRQIEKDSPVREREVWMGAQRR